MHDTPKTDRLDCELHNPTVLEDRYSAMRDHASELERENARLREALERAHEQAAIHSSAYRRNGKEATERLLLGLPNVVMSQPPSGSTSRDG